MSADPLLDAIIEIFRERASQGLILVGGYAISLKQRHLLRTGDQVLIPPLLEPRPTSDIDLILRVSCFCKGSARKDIRPMLDQLGYTLIAGQEKLQFSKPLSPTIPGANVKIDFLSRQPVDADGDVKFDERRVGTGSGIDLHGRTTPEAFAVEDAPSEIIVQAGAQDHKLLIANAYSLTNMKVKAAHDWLLAPEKKPYGRKHVADVYRIVASLTQGDIAIATGLREKYADMDIAKEVKRLADDMFNNANSPAWTEVKRQLGSEVDHATFIEGLNVVLGL